MKTLILIRHAKSSWDVPVSDKERQLIQSGIDSIKNIAQVSKSVLPETFIIWSSTAKRAMQTAYLYCETTNISKENIIFNDDLYTFNAIDLTRIIKNCPNTSENLIVFGHNSAITDFVNQFSDKFIDNVPTAGLVFIKFEENNWKNIQNGKIIHTFFPKEIL